MGLLEIAYKYEQSLFERHDEKDGTPLSTAASIGYLDGVRFIVQKFPNHAYDRGPLGCCPIHRAARKGHVKVIREFLRLCPDSGELLNWSCQNILHMAAESGRANVVMFILQVPHLEMLINETDQLGNTPLHLATTAACFKVVEILTRDKRVLLDLEDNKGHTVVDAAQRSSNADSPSVRQCALAQAEL
ncbi:unnamed protein product [Thlaspi arvense]|uniref:Uncharacterized protein n=1 Tax=Thlaspi arvense TaxID=13288 RepID=A0AAU9SI23_THLAR|nr:unnamed protein product [Thlaspi arvense]